MREELYNWNDEVQVITTEVMRDLSGHQNNWESDEDGAGWAQLGFEILKTSIGVFWEGDIRYTGPTSQIGVVMPNKPDLDFNTSNKSRKIINFRSEALAGIETVNVKFRCRIQYNGPEVVASFGFDAGGKRARLGRDVEITVRNPLALKTVRTSKAWRDVGIKRYPVIKIPIEFRFDDLWPNPNREETFTLILSGMWGFGAPGLSYKMNRKVVKN
jgi:hypothetical protein